MSPRLTHQGARMSRQQLSGAIAYQEGQGLYQVRRWRAFAVLAVSFFMTVVDLTIVNVALPTIGRGLHFSESNLQWIVTAYAITFGGFLLLGGRAAVSGASGYSPGPPRPDGNGRRPLFSSARRQALVAIRYSQVRSDARPSKSP